MLPPANPTTRCLPFQAIERNANTETSPPTGSKITSAPRPLDHFPSVAVAPIRVVYSRLHGIQHRIRPRTPVLFWWRPVSDDAGPQQFADLNSGGAYTARRSQHKKAFILCVDRRALAQCVHSRGNWRERKPRSRVQSPSGMIWTTAAGTTTYSARAPTGPRPSRECLAGKAPTSSAKSSTMTPANSIPGVKRRRILGLIQTLHLETVDEAYARRLDSDTQGSPAATTGRPTSLRWMLSMESYCSTTTAFILCISG